MEKKLKRNSVKINLNDYSREMRGLIVNKLRANESYLPDNNYSENKSIHKNTTSVFHVTPLI